MGGIILKREKKLFIEPSALYEEIDEEVLLSGEDPWMDDGFDDGDFGW